MAKHLKKRTHRRRGGALVDYLPSFLKPAAKAPEVGVVQPVPAPLPSPTPAPSVAGRRRTRKHRKSFRGKGFGTNAGLAVAAGTSALVVATFIRLYRQAKQLRDNLNKTALENNERIQLKKKYNTVLEELKQATEELKYAPGYGPEFVKAQEDAIDAGMSAGRRTRKH